MIRAYETRDTDRILTIWQAASAVAHPFLSRAFIARETENMRDIYLPHATTYVIEDGGPVLGFASIVGDALAGLFLDPAHIGHGYGRALVDHAVAQHGPLKVEVFDRNTGGRRFYARYGFVETAQSTHNGSGEVVRHLILPS